MKRIERIIIFVLIFLMPVYIEASGTFNYENGENQVVFDNVEVEETPIETVEETETISE